MILRAIALPLAGVLWAVPEVPILIRMGFVLAIAVAAIYDLTRGVRRTRPLRNRPHLVSIAFAQALFTGSWLHVAYSRPMGLGITYILQLILIALPWLCIWRAATREVTETRIVGLTPSGIGVLIWCSISVFALKLGYAGGTSTEAYGGMVVGSFMSDARVVLPGFWGIVSGGVLSGIAVCVSIAGVLLFSQPVARFAMCCVCAVGAYGIYSTDLRSAAGAVVISVAILALHLCAGFKRSGIEFARKAASYCLVALPVALPVVSLALNSLESVARGILGGGVFVRSDSESLLSIGGRTDIWAASLELACTTTPSLVALNSVGEFGAGVSDSLFLMASMPGTAESAHSHNSILNAYYSYGIIGPFVFVIMNLFAARGLNQLKERRDAILLLAPFTAFMIHMATESLLSVAYQYFGLILVLLNIDIFHDAETHSRSRN